MKREISNLKIEDMESVLSIQRKCYVPLLLEEAETFLKKLAMFPAGCLCARTETGLAGYVFAHPWITDEIVPLNGNTRTLPERCDALYIHDLAVAPESRGMGTARALIDAIFAVARSHNLANLSLVAVQNSEPFWEHWGFKGENRFEYVPQVPATHMIRRGIPL